MRYLSLVPTVMCVLGWGSVPGQQVTDVKPPAAAAAKPAPDKPISPETRGDVFMARKMYREAIDAYKEIQPPTAISLTTREAARDSSCHPGSPRSTAIFKRMLRSCKSQPTMIN